MTPKEKAEELIGKYIDIEMPKDCNYSNIGGTNAKQCALIAANEIYVIMVNFHGRDIEDNIHQIKYWQEVKQEIEKL